MRCKTCDYRLWNLTARRCPECGTPFAPSEHEFVPNTVQFCCPHCDKPYYGTGAKGHLVPPTFDCISCGNHVHMDEMVLRPTTGVQEEQTATRKVPWLERKQRGMIRAWLATVGQALVSPHQLMRALPERTPALPAWGFAVRSTFLVALVALVPVMLFPMMMAFGLRANQNALEAVAAIVLIAVVGAVATIAYMLAWGLVAHGLLRLTGRTAEGCGRTYQALCYSSGANVASAVPCLGFYVGWIWWLVSAVVMVKVAQRVHAARAVLATVLLPVLTIGGAVAWYIWFMFSVLSTASTFQQFGVPQTQTVLTSVLSYSAEHSGQGPAHAAMLVTEGYLPSSALVSVWTTTLEQQVPVADTTLDQLSGLPPDEARAAAQAAAGALPDATVAHRLGDFVFTYHGIDFNAADPKLWIVIMSPAPDSNSGTWPWSVCVGLADGSVVECTPGEFAQRLREQNQLRADHNLPPIPDASQVTHRTPAVDESGDK